MSRSALTKRVHVSARRGFGASMQAAKFVKPSIPIQTKLFINGQFVDSQSGETIATLDPRDESVIANFAAAGKLDVDLAVAAARHQFDEGAYSRMGGYERSKLLWKLADLLERDMDYFMTLESWDNGKPKAPQAWVDLHYAIQHFRYFAGWADKIHGKTIPMDSTLGRHQTHTLHEPIGVVGAIIPWNFPLLMAAWKLAPALAMGCTMVLKPAETTPLTALALANLIAEAGFPEGTVNIVPGLGETAGAALANHPGVDKVAFTGETGTGKLIMKAAAENLKPVTLELGGKSPAVVCEDADIDQFVQDMHVGLFWNAGQCCCASSRIFVEESRYDEFIEKMVASAKERKIGDGVAADGDSVSIDQGPQQNREQFEKVMSMIEEGKSSGKAKLLHGGSRIGDKGYFVESTIFGDVQDDAMISRDEIFGPVMCATKYSKDNWADMVRRCNSTEYGLAAGIYSSDINKVNAFSREVRAGCVWVNCYDVFDAGMPFGGYKSSGIGREKGEYALENFTQVKAVCTKLRDGIKGPY
jgi:aldehyde dehydrogenase (NAD+)